MEVDEEGAKGCRANGRGEIGPLLLIFSTPLPSTYWPRRCCSCYHRLTRSKRRPSFLMQSHRCALLPQNAVFDCRFPCASHDGVSLSFSVLPPPCHEASDWDWPYIYGLFGHSVWVGFSSALPFCNSYLLQEHKGSVNLISVPRGSYTDTPI